MKVAVIGLGEFGSAAAIGLARSGAEVIAIDSDMERIDTVKAEVAIAVCADARRSDVLEEHGIKGADTVVAAIGGNFEAQVLVVVHSRGFGVERIIARATTKDHRMVLEAVGATQVFNPEEEAAQWMVQRLMLGNIKSYFELEAGFSLMEIVAPPNIVGKTLKDLNLRQRHRINLVALKRYQTATDGTPVLKQFDPVPSPTEHIRENDILALAGSVLDLASFMGENEK